MSNFASVDKHVLPEHGVHAWALDFPQAGASAKVGPRGLYLQGWLLPDTPVAFDALIVCTTAHGEQVRSELPFNNARPDVIQRVLGQAPEAHPLLRCGFIAWLADVPRQFTLGVRSGESTTWLCDVHLNEEMIATKERPALQVIQGSAGWLFLDNDTNHSVDQFTGRLTLDAQGLERWRAYLDAALALAGAVGARHALVLAASKEQVVPEHYPHRKGALTVHEQVLALCGPQHHVVDTAALLAARTDREACFIRTDTHWTDRGAMLATLALLGELGLDVAQAGSHLARDVYYTAPFAGDLGVKLAPAQAAPTEFLQAPPAASGAVIDNALPNIGRVLVFEDGQALWPLHVLIFGASSSYPMLKYLKRLFQRIVFIHSAGNVDPAIVEHERPDLLVLQTTARFMIEPPNTSFDLRATVEAKLGKAAPNDFPPYRMLESAL
jgi:alginate O-acetyltransferase complex protein AlgJ